MFYDGGMTSFQKRTHLEPCVHKHITTVRINQTVDNKCGEGQGEVWTVFKMTDTSPHTQTSVKSRIKSSQHLDLIQHVSLYIKFTRKKNKTTPEHHVASDHGPINRLMCDVALSSTQEHDDHVDPQHKNTMNN